MKERWWFLMLPAVTLYMETLPKAAVCIFAFGPGMTIRETYSYFNLTPFGYANFAPLITAILTCVIFVLLVIFGFTGKLKIARVARNMLCACSVISLAPLLYGIDCFSGIGALITVSLVGELVFLHITVKDMEARG